MGLLLGLLSALIWGVAGVTGSLAARRLGPARAIAWSMALSMLAAIPLALWSGLPDRIDVRMALWILLITACMLGGLVFVYAGVRYGSISVVSPISATYGGVGAVLAIVTGEPVKALAVVALTLAVVGAFLAAKGTTEEPGAAYSNQRVAALCGAGAALLWGLQLWAGSQVQDDIGDSWLVACTRMVGVLVVTVPLAVRLQLIIGDRKALWLALAAGVGEVAGFTLYLKASVYGVAQAAVLTGQYGTVAAVIGVVVLKERLRGLQYLGIGLIVLAVIGLSLS